MVRVVRFALGVSCLAVALVLVSTQATAQAPTEAALSVSYGGETGLMTVTQTLDRAPRRLGTGVCTMRLRASVYYEGDSSAESERTISVRKIRSKVTSFRFRNLPEISRQGEADRAVVTLQSRITCRRNGLQVANIISNADAVYVACGTGTRTVSPRQFMRELASRAN